MTDNENTEEPTKPAARVRYSRDFIAERFAVGAVALDTTQHTRESFWHTVFIDWLLIEQDGWLEAVTPKGGPGQLSREDQLRALALTQAGSLSLAKEMYKFLLGEEENIQESLTVEAFNDGFRRGQSNMLDKLYNALQGRAVISTDANWISDVIQQLRFEVR